MGKLKFTLSNIWFWAALIGTSIIAENLQFLSSGMTKGLSFASVFVMAFSAVICLFMFYFINHKENKMKFDYVLTPIFILAGLCMLASIWSQPNGTLANIGGGEVELTIGGFERMRASITCILFLFFTYGMLFAINRTQPHSKGSLVPVYIGIIFVYVAIIYSLIAEAKVYASFDPKQLSGGGLESFFGNKNYYGGIIFVGILCCMIANYHRPRLFHYLTLVVFLLALLSTASVLPTLIAMFAIPIYLVEEAIRFAVKKKWRLVIYVTVTILILLSLVFIFYLGVIKHWKLIEALNNYVTRAISQKNYQEMSGRTKLWNFIMPYFFDSPLHALLGHGFMISQRYMFSYSDVRTTHNGYLQVLFDFGILGVIIHLVLLCYLLYSLIRLLIDKKFHFVFVYGFCLLAYGIYNIAESSPLFGYGIKELFVTFTLATPVMGRAKRLMHIKIEEEAKALPVQSGELNPIRLGKGMAAIIVSFMMITIPALMCPFTYDNKILTIAIVLSFVALLAALLFVPYLVSLWYRNTDKLNFVLHCVFNSLGFVLLIFGIAFPLIQRGRMETALWLAPFAGFIFLVVDTVIYAFAKHGSFKEWVVVTFVGGLFEPLAGILGTFIVSGAIYITIWALGDMNWFVYLFTFLISLCVFYFFFHFLPLGNGRDVINEFNRISLYHNKCCALKDEHYNG